MATRESTSAAGRPRRGEWAARSRERGLGADAALLDEARRNTRDATGDPAFLFTLADEIARARAPELMRAWRSLVAVMAGFRNTRARGGRAADAAAQPCVVLVVRRKRDLPPGHAQRLPSWLVTHADRDGRRRPFALPTDVQDADDHRGLRAHGPGPGAIWTQAPGFDTNIGGFACLVRADGESPAGVYLMSAAHVLSPDLGVDGNPGMRTLAVKPVDAAGAPLDTPLLATGSPYGGTFAPDAGNGAVPSLDLQLARVDPARLDAVLDMCALRGVDVDPATATDVAALAGLAGSPGRFELLCPGNDASGAPRSPVVLRLSGTPSDADVQCEFVDADAEVVRWVLQRGVVRFDAVDPAAVPLPGDSGSAIVFRHGATGQVTLVGMHVAGDGLGASLAVPAWSMFDTTGWSAAPPGGLSLVDAG